MQHVEAAHPRQHDVEQDEIERLAGGALEPALAVGARVDAVAFAGQAIGAASARGRVRLRRAAVRFTHANRRAARRDAGRRTRCALAALLGWPPADTTVNSLPAARRAADGDPAAVRFDDPLDQAQAEAGALDLRRDDVGRAIERLEDARLLGGRDADAAIGDGDADISRPAARARCMPIQPPPARRT